jgi:hypothetical protein
MIYYEGGLLSENLGAFSRTLLMTAVFYHWHSAMTVSRHFLLQGFDPPSASTDSMVMDETGNLSEPTSRHSVIKIPSVSSGSRAEWRTAASVALGLLCRNLEDCSQSDAMLLRKMYHYISILLHVPLHPLCDYVGWLGTEADIAESREKLCAWIKYDAENARRAVLHAAILFNLTTKRKGPAYFENHYLFLSFLALWSFFSLQSVVNPVDSSAHSPATGDLLICNVDDIDGVETDESNDFNHQQAWISGAVNLVLHIPGVGNLHEPASLRRALVEAHRVWLCDTNWGVNQKFALVLEGLISSGNALSCPP